jgi:alpha-glucuronidase
MLTVLLLSATLASPLHAEDGHDAWLRYARLEKSAAQDYASLPSSAVVLGDSPILHSAQTELLRGFKGMLDRTLTVSSSPPDQPAIVLATADNLRTLIPSVDQVSTLRERVVILRSTPSLPCCRRGRSGPLRAHATTGSRI